MSYKNNKSILFFTKSGFRAAELVFTYPNKVFHVREFARESRLSTTAVTAAINELKKYGIIRIEETEVTRNFKADLDSQAYTDYKLIFNLYRLRRYGLIDDLITHFNNPEVIVVFGSFAKGEDTEESDIDILIIAKNKGIDIDLSAYEKDFKRKINLNILSSIDKSSSEFKNAIANGIVLYGYLRIME